MCAYPIVHSNAHCILYSVRRTVFSVQRTVLDIIWRTLAYSVRHTPYSV